MPGKARGARVLLPFFAGLALTICQSESIADTKAVTVGGRVVILRDDGTWVYEGAPADTPAPSAATDAACDKLVTETYDEVSGQHNKSSKRFFVSDDGATGFNVVAHTGDVAPNVVLLSMQIAGETHCVDADSKMLVLFTDGSRVEVEADSNWNCRSNFTIGFDDIYQKYDVIEQLSTKMVKTIRVWHHSGYLQGDLTLEQATDFRSAMACLYGSIPQPRAQKPLSLDMLR